MRLHLRWLAVPALLLLLTASIRAEESLEPAALPPDIAPEQDLAPPPEEDTPDDPAVPETAPPPEAAAPPTEVTVETSVFPFPEGLRGHVEFWKNVFGVWGSRQVAFHDIEHPGLVYEVLNLGTDPGTSTQDDELLIRVRRETLVERLKRLEILVEMRAPLTEDEKQLALLITTEAGTDAIRGAGNRVRSQKGVRERFRRGLEISGRYDRAFREVFREAGLPEDIAYLPHVESSFQAYARSSAGAVGLWQFTRGAGRLFMNVNSSIDERLDPVASARGAARYLKRAHDLLGDWALAITSYNHGMDGMARARGRFGNDFDRIVREYDGKLFGFASKNFYAEFLAAREVARHPERYFPEGVILDRPLPYDQVVLDKSLSPVGIAQKYGVGLTDLASLNPAWSKRAVRGGRTVPAGSSVWLPEGTLARIAAARGAKKSAPPKPAVERAQAKQPAQAATEAILSELVHVVRKGETLVKIASSYGVRLGDLLLVNQLTERTVIRPGQSLRVPAVR